MPLRSWGSAGHGEEWPQGRVQERARAGICLVVGAAAEVRHGAEACRARDCRAISPGAPEDLGGARVRCAACSPGGVAGSVAEP
eukprot:13968993-Alexandrium_andersonii.AAC.1